MSFFHVRALVVKHLATGNVFEVSVSQVHGASLWQPRWVPPPGTHISTKQHGACTLVVAKRSPDMDKYYSFCMSTCLQEIRCRRIWNILLAFQLYVHASTSSQSLAEAVASFLQTLKRRNLNEKMSTKKLVWATQLKSVGLKGMGKEEGVLSMALNVHFHRKNPDGWHFVARRSTKSAFGDRCSIRRQVRLLRQPDWIGTPLLDLIKSGQLKLSKQLPEPENAILNSREERQKYRQLGVYSKRQRIGECADTQFDPQALPSDLWRRLGVSTLSLPAYLRPASPSRQP